MAARTRSRGVDGKPGKRQELTDEGWERIVVRLPAQARGGRGREHCVIPDGMLWVRNSGAPWRDMPARYGRWERVYRRYRRCTREGLVKRVLNRLHFVLDDQGRIDWSVLDVDGSNVRSHCSTAGASNEERPDEPTDHARGRSRGGFGTKLQLVTERRGCLWARSSRRARLTSPGRSRRS